MNFQPGDRVILTQGFLVDVPGTYLACAKGPGYAHLCEYDYYGMKHQSYFGTKSIKLEHDSNMTICEDWS